MKSLSFHLAHFDLGFLEIFTRVLDLIFYTMVLDLELIYMDSAISFLLVFSS